MKEIAVYTCVTGSYDTIREPLAVENECDYYIISDNGSAGGDIYEWIDVDLAVPDKNMSNKDKNRYCKLHPHLLFPKYRYTIYLDGSIQILRPISHYIERIGKCGLALHDHRASDCVYSEGIFLTWLGVAQKDEIVREASRFMEEGLPKHFGLRECSMIVTDTANPIIPELYENWYENYLHGSKRDQQALVYTLWEMGFDVDDVGRLGGQFFLHNNPDISWNIKDHYGDSGKR